MANILTVAEKLSYWLPWVRFFSLSWFKIFVVHHGNIHIKVHKNADTAPNNTMHSTTELISNPLLLVLFFDWSKYFLSCSPEKKLHRVRMLQKYRYYNFLVPNTTKKYPFFYFSYSLTILSSPNKLWDVLHSIKAAIYIFNDNFGGLLRLRSYMSFFSTSKPEIHEKYLKNLHHEVASPSI